jgi:mRNA interferase RelE/StbE
LKGQDGNRIRVGEYRVLYLIDDRDHEVTVSDIAHRREVYRRR